jgi:hypothetical protein
MSTLVQYLLEMLGRSPAVIQSNLENEERTMDRSPFDVYIDRTEFKLEYKRSYGRINSLSERSKFAYISYWSNTLQLQAMICCALSEINNGVPISEVKVGTNVSFSVGEHKKKSIKRAFDVWPHLDSPPSVHHRGGHQRRIGYYNHEGWQRYSPVKRIPLSARKLLKRSEIENG